MHYRRRSISGGGESVPDVKRTITIWPLIVGNNSPKVLHRIPEAKQKLPAYGTRAGQRVHSRPSLTLVVCGATHQQEIKKRIYARLYPPLRVNTRRQGVRVFLQPAFSYFTSLALPAPLCIRDFRPTSHAHKHRLQVFRRINSLDFKFKVIAYVTQSFPIPIFQCTKNKEPIYSNLPAYHAFPP